MDNFRFVLCAAMIGFLSYCALQRHVEDTGYLTRRISRLENLVDQLEHPEKFPAQQWRAIRERDDRHVREMVPQQVDRFICRVCGKPCAVAPFDGQGICPACCKHACHHTWDPLQRIWTCDDCAAEVRGEQPPKWDRQWRCREHPDQDDGVN